MTIQNLKDYDLFLLDCYGTLIDWETGILTALSPIFSSHQIDIGEDEVLEAYAVLEAAAESTGYRPYRIVLAEVLKGLGSKYGFNPSEQEYSSFSNSVKFWPPFEDSAAALRKLRVKYKLAVLSNIDDDLFTHSEDLLGLKFDHVFTAEAIGSYKPDLCNFEYAINKLGLPTERILHVAQSLFHDIEPAQKMGLSTVWINRRKHKTGSGATPPSEARPDLEFPDLASLAAETTVKSERAE